MIAEKFNSFESGINDSEVIKKNIAVISTTKDRNQKNFKPMLEQNHGKKSKLHENKRLKQIDARVKHNVFLVSKWLNSPQEQTKCADCSLFIFGPKNKFRLLAIKITEAKLYEYFILLTIIITCVIMALDVPMPYKSKSKMNKFSDEAEYFFLVIFGSEAFLKIIAKGFVMHPNSYLRSLWNVIDFFVVLISLLNLVQNHMKKNVVHSLDVRSVRAVRVLRPLKLITIIPSVHIIMTSIMKAVVPLLKVSYLFSFMIAIYAIIGLQFMVNRFKYSCKNGLTKKFTDQLCDGRINGSNKYFVSGVKCATDESCVISNLEINNGIKTFDNIFFAVLTVFQCVTTDGWSEIMYKTFYTMDKKGYLWSTYYVSLVMLGTFIVLNLVLGVLNGEFSKERSKVEHRSEFIKLREKIKLDQSFEFYFNWILKGEELVIAEVKSFNYKFNALNYFAEIIGEDCSRGLFKIHKDKTSKLHFILLYIKSLQLKARKLVKHKIFFWFVLSIVFLNTIFMATYRLGQPHWQDDLKVHFERLLGSIFIVELLLKVFAFTLKGYCRSSFNIFEFVVVFLSFIEIVSNWSIGLTALRCFILLRVLKVTKYWSRFRHIVESFKSAVNSLFSLFFLLLLFIFINALLGMHLFSGRFESLQGPNFNGPTNSILAVFQVISGEDWSSIMYSGMKVYENKWMFYFVCVYFLFLVLFGNYILLNIFLAIVVDNLAKAEILTDDEVQDNIIRIETKRRIVQFYNNGISASCLEKSYSDVQLKSIETKDNLYYENQEISDIVEISDKRKEGSEIINKNLKSDFNPENIIQVNNLELKFNKDVEMSKDVAANVLPKITNTNCNEFNNEKNLFSTKSSLNFADDFELNIAKQGFFKTFKNSIVNKKDSIHSFILFSDSSLFIFSSTNRFRVLCRAIVRSKYFDLVMIAIISVRSLVLVIEDPINLYSYPNKISGICDYVFTAIFGIEIFLKIVDTGFVLRKGSFLRDSWNRLDAFVFFISLLSIILSRILQEGNIALKVVRIFRVLRPLKFVQYVKKLKIIFLCMIYSFKVIGFVLIIAFLMLFIFACVGVQLFKGKFYYCTDEIIKNEDECKGLYFKYDTNSYKDTEMFPEVKRRKWKNEKFHFDNVLDALVTLFVCSTEDNWPTKMYKAMNIPNEKKGHLVMNYSYAGIYFIVFMVIFTFFIINIFVALIILTFQKQGEIEIQAGLDQNQHACLEYVLNSKPCKSFMPINKSSVSFRMWHFVKSHHFDNFMVSITLMNMLLLMLRFKGMTINYGDWLIKVNGGFTSLYLIEALLKIIAYRLTYFKDFWNLFDIAVILGGFLDIIFTFTQLLDPTMFRLFRVARLLKLFKRQTGVEVILWTLLKSLINLAYVIVLILITTYVYAIMGMQLFGNIKLEKTKQLNEMNNFCNIFKTILLLFRCSSGDNWSEIMSECYDNAKCNETYLLYTNVPCGNTTLARIYFISYMFLSRFFLLNLFVAVIMDNFEYLTRDNSIMCLRDLKEFVSCWSKFDPQATGYITNNKLYELMRLTSPPIGFGTKCPKAVCFKRMMQMNIPLNADGNVSFHTVLMTLVRFGLKIHLNKNDVEFKSVINSLWPDIALKSLDKFFPDLTDKNQLTVRKVFSIKLIFMSFQKKKH
ncbi:voltage-dependent R-type calcium channel subunit alpha-1E-like isoform X2 [Hydra vulgaris]|uniref:Voltage-dependent R-type calcium channel subunit alpha-1E-like isoform X2 n=1 Tax=Hydra vulgaris TaxID=6087 RepID=A0ABM4BFT9_HYDVU